MNITLEYNTRIADYTFAEVYLYYVTTVENKGRTKKELHRIIERLTRFY